MKKHVENTDAILLQLTIILAQLKLQIFENFYFHHFIVNPLVYSSFLFALSS